MAGSSGSSVWTEGLCPALQVKLIEIAENQTPGFKRGSTGLLTCITDAPNTNGFLQRQVDMGDGKRNEGTGAGKKVLVRYSPRFTESDFVTDDVAGDCDAERDKQPCQEEVEITNYVRSKKIEFSEWEMRRLCEGQESFLAEEMQKLFDGGARKINELISVDLAGQIGEYKDGTTSKSFNILNADGSSNFFGESEMMRQMREAEVSGGINVVGGGNWYLYANNRDKGGLQDTGIQIDQTGMFRLYYDNQVQDASVLGDDNGAFILAENAVQFLEWNANVGIYRKATELFVQDTIVDPVTGITWDLNMSYTYCGTRQRKWVMYIEKNFDLFTLPTDAFATSDRLSGVNYVFKGIGAQLP